MKETKAGLIIILIAVAVASLIFFRGDLLKLLGFQNQKVKVPQELILGDLIDSSKVRLEFPDLNKVDFVQFNSTKTPEELSAFYASALKEAGWTIIEQSNSRIVANRLKGELNINIVILPQQKGPNLVGIIYRQK